MADAITSDIDARGSPATAANGAVGPSPTRPAGAPPGPARELSNFLLELSVALHRRTMYPGGHPSLAAAEERVTQRLGPLLAAAGQVAIGVAAEQLVIDGVATDVRNHLLRALAERLHGHRVAGFRLHTGITGRELTDFLARLATDPRTAGEPITMPGTPSTPWPHITVYRQSYERLELLDAGEEGGFGPAVIPRAAQLWMALAGAALALPAEDASVAPDVDPADVARAINARSSETAYEQVVVGYLLQIADELRAGRTEETAVLRARVSRLVHDLSPEAIRRLLGMGGNLSQRHAFLNDAAEGMAVDAVLTLTVAAADVSQQAISKPLLRLLVKLASHSRRGPVPVRGVAEGQFREQVREMIDGWHLPDPAAGGYSAMLDRLASPDAGPFALGITQQCEPERVLEMSIELRNAAPALWDAIATLTARGDILFVLDSIDAASADNPLPGIIRTRIATPEHFARLLAAPTVDAKRLEDFARRVGQPAIGALLDALSDSQSRTTRRKLLGVLTRLGDAIGSAVVARLAGAPWYMQRNLLILLGEIANWPADFSPMPFAGHHDSRVRREALRLMLRRPVTRSAAIAAALNDGDLQIVRIGLDACQKECPAAAVPRFVQKLATRALPADMELLAVRTLAATGAPDALPCLLGLVTTRTRWLRRERLAPKSPTVLAILGALALRWQDEPAAARVLHRAARSSDPEIRAAGAARSAGRAA